VECEPPAAAALSALKKADDRDSVVLRLFNPGAGAVQVRVTGDRALMGAFRTNLREQRKDPLLLENGRAVLSLGPRKIATMEFLL
jgi:alpha-mannosidase